MFNKTIQIAFLFGMLFSATTLFSQCTHCSNPASPTEYGGALTVTEYKNSTLQLWAAKPAVAVDGRDWFKVKTAGDTTYVGSGDTLTVTVDTTCKYIAHNINNCTCGGTYYSSYVTMATITSVDSPSVPSFWPSYAPTVCSGSPTNIFLSTKSTISGLNFQYLRDDTANVSGSMSGSGAMGPMGITLTNKTSSNQVVRFVVRMFNPAIGKYFDSKSFYITVLPSSASSGDHCTFPSAPRANGTVGGVSGTFYKGANFQLLADTTVMASAVDWYKVVGTDTTSLGSGSTFNTVTDTSCVILARNRNTCTCDTSSYLSAYALMGTMTVTANAPPMKFRVLNGVPTIASGTALDLVMLIDSNTASNSLTYSTFTFFRDNALVSGTTTATITSTTSFGFVLTNTTTSMQLVKYQIRSQTTSGGVYGNAVTGYVLVEPSTITGQSGSHCKQPPVMLSYNSTVQNLYYVKGASVNLDMNPTISVLGFDTSADYIDFYKSRWAGDTIYIGHTSPVYATIDSNCKILAISKNTCMWSDSSIHTYVNYSTMSIDTVTTGSVPAISAVNSSPELCSGTATSITLTRSNSTSPIVWYRADLTRVTNTSVSPMTSSPATFAPTLSDTMTTPQTAKFLYYAYVNVGSNTYAGSSTIVSVKVNPTCAKWVGNVVAIHPANDTICSGDTATLVSDTLLGKGGTHYAWSSGDTTRTIHKTSAGTYTVTATNSCGCTATASAVVVVKSLPTVTVNRDSICPGDTATLTATGGISYRWGVSDTLASIRKTAGGTYTVTATNSVGCSATTNGVVVIKPVPTISGDNDSTCLGTNITLTANGGISYRWSNGDTTASSTVFWGDVFTVSVTNSYGCTATKNDTVTLRGNNIPSVGNQTICSGDTATLTATGSSSYLWSTSATTSTISATTAGTYTVTSTNASGCSATASATVTVLTNPTPSISSSGGSTICKGSPTILSVSGSMLFHWSMGDSISTASVVNSGTYYVSVTDSLGCHGVANIVISVKDTPTVTASSDSIYNYGDTVTITASGAIHYLWNTGDSTASLSKTVAGDFIVTGTDTNGCGTKATGQILPSAHYKTTAPELGYPANFFFIRTINGVPQDPENFDNTLCGSFNTFGTYFGCYNQPTPDKLTFFVPLPAIAASSYPANLGDNIRFDFSRVGPNNIPGFSTAVFYSTATRATSIEALGGISYSGAEATITTGTSSGYDFSEGIFKVDISDASLLPGDQFLESWEFVIYGPYQYPAASSYAPTQIGNGGSADCYKVAFNYPGFRGMQTEEIGSSFAGTETSCTHTIYGTLQLMQIDFDYNGTTFNAAHGGNIFADNFGVPSPPVPYLYSPGSGGVSGLPNYFTESAGQTLSGSPSPPTFGYTYASNGGDCSKGVHTIALEESGLCDVDYTGDELSGSTGSFITTFQIYVGPPCINITSVTDGNCPGSNVSLFVGPSYSGAPGWSSQYTYAWSDNASVPLYTSSSYTTTTTTGTSIFAHPSNSAVYTVTATDPNGCTATASVTVDIDNTCCISPDGTAYTFNGAITSTAFLNRIAHAPGGAGLVNLASSPPLLSSGAKKIVINNTLTLDNNLKMLICSDISFGSNGSIIVPAGFTLDIEKNTTLYACGSAMWDGIILNAGSGTTLGGKLIDNGSFIMDARAGVKVNNTDNAPAPSVLLQNASFFRDYIGAWLIGACSLTANNSKFIYDPSVAATYPLKSTVANQSAIPNLHPEAGIIITANLGNTTIGNDFTQLPNQFTGLNSGIANFWSNLTVANNVFTNIRTYNLGSNLFTGSAIYTYGINGLGYNDAPTTVTTSLTKASHVNPVAFQGCDTAIFSNNATLTATNNSINGTGTSNSHGIITNTVLNKGINIYDNYINNIDYGVSLLNNTFSLSNVYNNRINVNPPILRGSIPHPSRTKGTFGIFETELFNSSCDRVSIYNDSIFGGGSNIWLSNTNNSSIHDNNLFLTDFNQAVYFNSQSCILVNNSKALQISSNNITGNGTQYDDAYLKTTYPPSSSAHRRIGISLTMTDKTEMCNNDIQSIGYSTFFSGTCNGTRMRRNTLNNSRFGLVLATTGTRGIQGIIGPQGTLTTENHHNIFSGTFDNPSGYQTFSISSPGSQSKFYYYGSPMPYPNGSSPPSLVYDIAIASSSFSGVPSCHTIAFTCHKELESYAPDYTYAVASGDISGFVDSAYYDGALWLAKKQLYHELLDDSTLFTVDTTYRNFFYDTKKSEIGSLTEIEQTINALAIQKGDTGILDTSSYNTTLSNTAKKNATLGATLFSSNVQAINAIYFRTVAVDKGIVDSVDIALINTLAHSCPFDQGDAVYTARALYSLFTPMDQIDDNLLCTPDTTNAYRILRFTPQQTDSVAIAGTVSNYYAHVVPNPATNAAAILYSTVKDAFNRAEIYDNLGRLVFEYKDATNNGRINVDLSAFNAGIYMVRFISNDKVLLNTKLVVHK